jgi:[pyruvate, water dikinase]-phosphate phosphotransferase / [pyruvate, water dikinase] kinase
VGIINLNLEYPIIYVLSDSIGETGELVVKAAASQFTSGNIGIRRIPYLSSPRDVEDALLEAASCRAAVVYTLVRPELKAALITKAQELELISVDIMGPVIEALKKITGSDPLFEPGLIRKLDASYFNRIEAVDFAVQYDDGKQSAGLAKADVVIVGVSRTSKTPLCMYLAYKGLKAANIPLVPEVSPPEELFALSPRKVIGLIVKPALLMEVRKERLKSLGLAQNVDYANMGRINAELEYAAEIIEKIGCLTIDVTNKAVEETAATILEYYRKGERK